MRVVRNILAASGVIGSLFASAGVKEVLLMPTTDGRIVTLPRSVEPKPDLAILLDRLGLTLPAQPPPKISGEAADAAKSTVS